CACGRNPGGRGGKSHALLVSSILNETQCEGLERFGHRAETPFANKDAEPLSEALDPLIAGPCRIGIFLQG
ncbi:MAG: hypothetical protein WAN11_22575, partial [Syntrophobacteraceae bacterium]